MTKRSRRHGRSMSPDAPLWEFRLRHFLAPALHEIRSVGRVGHFSDFCVLEAKIPCLLSSSELMTHLSSSRQTTQTMRFVRWIRKRMDHPRVVAAKDSYDGLEFFTILVRASGSPRRIGKTAAVGGIILRVETILRYLQPLLCFLSKLKLRPPKPVRRSLHVGSSVLARLTT